MGSSAGKLEEAPYGGEDDSVDFMDDDPMDMKNCSNAYCVSMEDYDTLMRAHIFPTTIEWILIAAHIIVFVVGLVGNFLVCVAVYRNTSMRTVTNYFIVNLAVADFMVILFCLPPTVVWDVTETWFLGDTFCKILLYFQGHFDLFHGAKCHRYCDTALACQIIWSRHLMCRNSLFRGFTLGMITIVFETVSVSVSVLTLTFISVERWYAICFPLKFKATTSRAKRAIFAIWVISLLFDIPELVVLHTKPREGVQVDTILFTQCVPDWSGLADMTYSIFRIVLLYCLPLVFMTFAYVQIGRVLWSSNTIPGMDAGAPARRQTTQVSNGNTHVQYTARLLTPVHRGMSSQGTAVDFQLRSRRKAAKMLVAVVVMFAFCYLPVHIYTILSLIMTIPQTDFFGAIVLVSHWLPYANSAINPLIYNFMSEKFQKEFLRTFGCWMWSSRRRNRRLPIRRHMATNQSYNSGYTGRGLSTYSRNYATTATRIEQTQFTTCITIEK